MRLEKQRTDLKGLPSQGRGLNYPEAFKQGSNVVRTAF